MATIMDPKFKTPKIIADAGERFYATIKDALEITHTGKFVAINVESGKYYIGETPEQVLGDAKAADPGGLFHLIRIGFTGAFQVSYALRQTDADWLFR